MNKIVIFLQRHFMENSNANLAINIIDIIIICFNKANSLDVKIRVLFLKHILFVRNYLLIMLQNRRCLHQIEIDH